MSVWKKALAAYCALFVAEKCMFYILKLNAVGYYRAHLFRLSHVIDLNMFMILGTFFCWARVKALVEPSPLELAKRKSFIDDGSPQLAPIGNGSSRKRVAVGVAYWTFAFSNHFAYFLYYFVNDVEPTWFAWLCLCAVGVWTHLVVFVVGFSMVNFGVRLIQSTARGRDAFKPLFRVGLIKSILTDAKFQTWTAMVLTVAFSIVSLYAGARPAVREVDIKIKDLPESFDGFRIALVTDVHVGPTVGKKAVERVVNITNAQNPNIVAIAGDLVDGTVDDLGEAVKPLQHLRTTHGVYFTTGNHEMYYGRVEDWFTLLHSLNVQVLRNENQKLVKPSTTSGSLCLAGVDDVYTTYLGMEGHKMDVEKALNSCDSSLPTILLAHNPKGAQIAGNSLHRIDLILSGHTHAGQMYPIAPLMYLLSPYFYGLHRHSNGFTQIYVSSGVHYWGAPMKMLGYAEISLITLRR